MGLSSWLAESSRMRRILHGDGRAARLGGLEHRAPQGAQPRRQPVHLGGLAGAIHALEGDEETARHGMPPTGAAGSLPR